MLYDPNDIFTEESTVHEWEEFMHIKRQTELAERLKLARSWSKMEAPRTHQAEKMNRTFKNMA